MTQPAFNSLPADYDQLSIEGRRQARVAVLSCQRTPEDLVHAWAFFRANYLRDTEDETIGWYDPPVLESCEDHYRYVYDLGAYSRNVLAYPRGFGKSIILKELILLWALTRPHFKVVLVKSTDDFVHADFQQLMNQLEDNPRIRRDFGALKPRRGKGIWSLRRLWLANGFQLVGRSVLGKLLGLRPNFFAFDDAEFDPAMRLSPSFLTDHMEYLYYNHVRPMLNKGATVLLLGTLIHRKALIYRMAMADERDDPRVGFFNRVVLNVFPEGKPLWPERWDEETIAAMQAEMGRSAFDAQYMNAPGTEDEKLLPLHPQLSYYDVDETDAFTAVPLQSTAILKTYYKADDQIRQYQRPFGQVVSQMFRVILADPIREPSSTSDFACVMVLGMERSPEHKDHWYVLDLRLGRVKETIFFDWLWDLGQRWQVRIVGIESIGAQKKLVARVQDTFAERGGDVSWTPRVYPIKYAGDLNLDRGKGSRIAGLAWRFERNRILLPRHRMGQRAFRDLETQIQDFTEDLKLLPHDDAIDTLAMAQFIPRPKGRIDDEPTEDSVMQMLERGLQTFPGTNIPLLQAVNASELTPLAEQKISERRFRDRPKTRRRSVIRRRSLR